MDNLFDVMSREEYAAYSLRALYASFGYSHYRMSKFEEYDLYAKNKDFLVSENVITFTDTDGKLLALKPDVTLSIVKNNKLAAGESLKVYYHENVYRTSGSTRSFKELMQVGVEWQGRVDLDAKTEVVYLAVKSLDTISDNYVLELSHLDVVSAVLNALPVADTARKDIIANLAKKNIAALRSICDEAGLSDEYKNSVIALSRLYGKATDVLPKLGILKISPEASQAIDELCALISRLDELNVAERVFVDFSLLSDLNYYNGISFRGFLEGIPTGVLLGGQYDNLMQKLDKASEAIGFAVYLDELSRAEVKNG